MAQIRMHAAALLLPCAATFAAAAQVDDKLEELLDKQASAPDGVVHLNADDFNRLFVGKSRGYNVILFLWASHLMDKATIQLPKLRKEFGLLSKAYREEMKKTGQEGKIFFADIEFQESQEVFHRLGVQALPFVFRLPTSAIKRDGRIALNDNDKMTPDSFPNYPWSAEDMGSFTAERTGLPTPTIDRPSFAKSPLFPLIVLPTLASLAFLAWKVYCSDFIWHPLLWSTGAVFVCWFATSGGLYNIIRNVPMVTADQNGQPVFFMRGQGQLASEGFVLGTMEALFGISIAVLTHVAPKMTNSFAQRTTMGGVMVLALFCLVKVVGIYTWKTGYGIKTYF
eukprot:CAMPEP_0177792244 /NCGR_PEP_ID=MMETSP0491_2-20121128/24421_1 /TAXON_ID=63592 /ORGANISM="Tetraselmis chuii, Strain PLY429" /LENGTH=338 /DNA_ID=CAMNT_0019314645 /DNA_START=59 /DNA_END=1076 /DNA_ORIENTATION=-